MAASTARRWISYQEAAELYGLSRTTLWRLISAGEIRAAKVGKLVKINRGSLEEYLERQDYTEVARQ